MRSAVLGGIARIHHAMKTTDKSGNQAMTNSERQAAYRKRSGVVKTITINLTETDLELLERCFSIQGHCAELKDFYLASLKTGALFRANSGTPKTQKVRR